MNRPTPDPSQEGSRHSSASCPVPSWEGLGVGSWSQCAVIKPWRLSMNQPAHREVLECASPLALSDLVRERKSGRGLPQSKMLARQRPPRRGSWFQCVRESDSGAAALQDGLISGRDYPKRASAAPAAAISGVCRDGDLLAKIIHVQPALRTCV